MSFNKQTVLSIVVLKLLALDEANFFLRPNMCPSDTCAHSSTPTYIRPCDCNISHNVNPEVELIN